MAKYQNQHAVVEAEQFFPDRHPWPHGVRVDEESCSGYSAVDEDGQIGYEVHPGDYLVVARCFHGSHEPMYYPVRAHHFERRYQPCP